MIVVRTHVARHIHLLRRASLTDLKVRRPVRSSNNATPRTSARMLMLTPYLPVSNIDILVFDACQRNWIYSQAQTLVTGERRLQWVNEKRIRNFSAKLIQTSLAPSATQADCRSSRLMVLRSGKLCNCLCWEANNAQLSVSPTLCLMRELKAS